MDRKTVFTKTAKGLMEASGKTSILSRELRNLLKEVDGKVNLEQLGQKLTKLPEIKLMELLTTLERDGFAKEFVSSQAKAPAASPSPQPPPPKTLLNATGGVEADAKGVLNGRVQVELRAQARSNMTLSGTLADPQFRRSN